MQILGCQAWIQFVCIYMCRQYKSDKLVNLILDKTCLIYFNDIMWVSSFPIFIIVKVYCYIIWSFCRT